MKTLITGARGYTARYLIEQLKRQGGEELYLNDCLPDDGRDVEVCDLTRLEQVKALIAKIRPDRIYQLAGSFSNDYETDYAANVLCSKNVMDSLLSLKISARLLLVGSAAEYGAIQHQDNPVSELQPLRPIRPYGVSKVFQSCLMDYYCYAHGLDIVMVRTFTLCGGDNQAVSSRLFVGSVARQIERLKRGEITKIVVGNLESKRDYLDIKDAVRWYQVVMKKGLRGQVYNVGSGRSVKMRDLLVRLLAEHGLDMSVVQEKPPTNPDKTDIEEIYADIRKLKKLGFSSL